MKKRIYIISFITLIINVVLLSSCEDFFTPNPTTGVQEEDFGHNREDLNAGALGIYAALSEEVHKFLLWGSARADLVTVGEEGKDTYVTEFVNNSVTDLNPYTNYAGLYKAIARCNQQLENVAKVAKIDFSLNDDDVNAYYGEVYYLRALCYFYLVRTFKECPLILDNLSEDITHITPEGDTIHLKTLDLTAEELRQIALKPAAEQELWKQINSDLKKAMGMLRMDFFWNGVNISDNERFGRANLPMAYALACDLALWMKEYLKASTFADLVIRNTAYSVTGSTTWGNTFTQSISKGHVVTLLGYNFSQSHNTNKLQEFTSPYKADGGAYLLKPVRDIVNTLFMDDRDIRINYTYKRINRQDIIWKYIGLDDKEAMRDPYESIASWHIYRTADIYLLKGFSENRQGNSIGAIINLNSVRKNRGLAEYKEDEIDLSMENIENLLLEERARELAFEGKRWYDLLLVSKVFGRTDLLPSIVSKKYPKEKIDAMYTHLQNQDNWYLPIDPQRWN